MARNAAIAFAFLELSRDIISYRASENRRAPIVMTVPKMMSSGTSADEVLDERLLRPPEGGIAINDITRITRSCQYKRFSRCSLCRSYGALYYYFENYCSQHFISQAISCIALQMKVGAMGPHRGLRKTGNRRGTDNIHHSLRDAHATGEVTGQTININDTHTQLEYSVDVDADLPAKHAIITRRFDCRDAQFFVKHRAL